MYVEIQSWKMGFGFASNMYIVALQKKGPIIWIS